MKKPSMTPKKLGWGGIISLILILILRYGIISRLMTAEITKVITAENPTKTLKYVLHNT